MQPSNVCVCVIVHIDKHKSSPTSNKDVYLKAQTGDLCEFIFGCRPNRTYNKERTPDLDRMKMWLLACRYCRIAPAIYALKTIQHSFNRNENKREKQKAKQQQQQKNLQFSTHCCRSTVSINEFFILFHKHLDGTRCLLQFLRVHNSVVVVVAHHFKYLQLEKKEKRKNTNINNKNSTCSASRAIFLLLSPMRITKSAFPLNC